MCRTSPRRRSGRYIAIKCEMQRDKVRQVKYYTCNTADKERHESYFSKQVRHVSYFVSYFSKQVRYVSDYSKQVRYVSDLYFWQRTIPKFQKYDTYRTSGKAQHVSYFTMDNTYFTQEIQNDIHCNYLGTSTNVEEERKTLTTPTKKIVHQR